MTQYYFRLCFMSDVYPEMYLRNKNEKPDEGMQFLVLQKKS